MTRHPSTLEAPWVGVPNVWGDRVKHTQCPNLVKWSKTGDCRNSLSKHEPGVPFSYCWPPRYTRNQPRFAPGRTLQEQVVPRRATRPAFFKWLRGLFPAPSEGGLAPARENEASRRFVWPEPYCRGNSIAERASCQRFISSEPMIRAPTMAQASAAT